MTVKHTYHYKIVPGSAGSFLAPPGHPTHTYHLEGYESTRHRTPIHIGSIMHARSPDFDGSEAITKRVRDLLGDAETECDEMWLRSMYAHFRNCYVPESGSRSASDVIVHSVTEVAVDRAAKVLSALGDRMREQVEERREAAERGDTVPAMPTGWNVNNYRRGITPVTGRRRGYEITAHPNGSKVYVYALADDGTRYSAKHLADYAEALEASDVFTDVAKQVHPEDPLLDRIVATLTDPPQPMAPERHSAVAAVREYFPDHEPRLDLIANPKPTAGLCEKCGKQVQYEAKLRKLVTGTRWPYNTECTDGGDHAR